MVRSRPAHLGFQRVAGDGTVARCSQVVDGGEVLVASGEGETTDELREVSTNPIMSSRCSFASSRKRKRRLETSRASGDGQGLDCCEINQKKIIRGGARERGEVIGERRRRGVLWLRRNRPGKPAGLRCSVEQFLQPGGDWEGEKRGYSGGGLGLLIGSVRGRNGRVITRIEEEN
jgi:hypothetical protein